MSGHIDRWVTRCFIHRLICRFDGFICILTEITAYFGGRYTKFMRTSILHYRIFGIQLQEYLLVLGFYFFISYSYALSIWINSFSKDYKPPLSDLYTPSELMDYSGLHYSVMLLLTAIIWWLIFRRFGHWPLKFRLLIHLITGPLFVFAGQRIYYGISDWLGWGHLSGSGSIWDIFIPALFYLL